MHRRSEEEKRTIDEFVTRMVAAGMLEPCRAPMASPLVLVKQKGKTRICVDYRAINEITTPDVFPQERIDDILASFEGCRWFSSVDTTSGYWQVPVDEGSSDFTAFRCERGVFRWKVLPFGLINAPSHFNRWLNRIFSDSKVFRYVDDLIIASKTYEEHVKALSEVLDKCVRNGIVLKPTKSVLFAREIKVLGHIVNSQGVKPDPQKVQAIRKFATPTSRKSVKTVLGMCGFYRRYVRNMSCHTVELRRLACDKTRFAWTKKAGQELEWIKEALVSEDVMLEHPDTRKPYFVHVDTSKYGVGAVLMQEDCKSRMKVVEYYSKATGRHNKTMA
jgi:hypothetical protein